MFGKYKVVDISNNELFPNIKVFESKLFKGGITFPGLGIVVCKREDMALIQHEYGHYLDYKNFTARYGVVVAFIIFYCFIGLPSLCNAIYDKLFKLKSHSFFYTETRADHLAKEFFGEKYLTDIRFSTYQKP